jgi:hypothetical protein
VFFAIRAGAVHTGEVEGLQDHALLRRNILTERTEVTKLKNGFAEESGPRQGRVHLAMRFVRRYLTAESLE